MQQCRRCIDHPAGNSSSTIFSTFKCLISSAPTLSAASADPPKVVFTTVFRKFAVEGFELDAVDYLLKPISFERFLKAVNKAMKLNLPLVQGFPQDPIPKNETEPSFLFLRADRKNLKIQLCDILFIESLKDYIKVVTKDRTNVTKQSNTTVE